MTFKLWFASVFATLTFTLSPQALAAYEYTYTSGSNLYFESNVVSGNGLNITPDDLIKIVIRSDNLLTPTDNLLFDASLKFSVGNYTQGAAFTEAQPPELNFTNLAISEFDNNNLPIQWAFDISRVVALAPEDNSSYFFLSSPEFNVFSASADTPRGVFNIISTYANTGNWTLNEISSPVPEVETYAMMITGLGLMGFVARRRKGNQ